MYYLFAGDNYYPAGGAYDFVGCYSTMDKAMAAAHAKKHLFHWCHIMNDKGHVEWESYLTLTK